MKLRTLGSRLAPAPRTGPKPLPATTVERKRGSAGMRDRANIRARDKGLCQECKRRGRTTLGHVVDHIDPLHLGGDDLDSNKELLCNPCHDAKSAREAKHRSTGLL
jgi:5-methylcytosine-specific restriction endonuclease McrA